MRRLISVVALGFFLAAPASAQQAPPTPMPTAPSAMAPGGPPSSDMQRRDNALATARAAAFAALSSDHQAKVTAIVDQIKAGGLTDLHDAVQKIDAILTPAEAKAVLGARDTMVSEIRGSMAAGQDGGGPPGGGPPGGGRPVGGPPPGGGFGGGGFGGGGRGTDGGRRGGMRGMRGMRNDAGFALLSLNVDRDQMRSMIMQARDPH